MIDQDRVLDDPNLNPEQLFSTYYLCHESGEYILADEGLTKQAAEAKVDEYRSLGWQSYIQAEVPDEAKEPV